MFIRVKIVIGNNVLVSRASPLLHREKVVWGIAHAILTLVTPEFN